MTITLIFDENIPNSVIQKIRKDNYKVISIREEHKGIHDEEIIKISQEKKIAILTMDKDFGYLTFHKKMEPYGIILMRINPQSPEFIYSTIKNVLKILEKRKIDLFNKFIVADGKTLRVRIF